MLGVSGENKKTHSVTTEFEESDKKSRVGLVGKQGEDLEEYRF